MKGKQFITRSIEIDIAHRVMHERMKCSSIHGHRVKVELRFLFTAQQDIGYCIDFKEIKRVAGEWLDDMMDHGFIANPMDEAVIKACKATKSKLYLMSLSGAEQYCNPTAENIAREIFMAMTILFSDYDDLMIDNVCYYETPNCWVDAREDSISEDERRSFNAFRFKEIKAYADHKGVMEYDSRKL